ncbi:MAG: DUF819 family protein [Peptococcaceae bacterium]|jgi:uncharacterized membrane protein|nr:DUF819 family protein [Peptococcaceae bacterium]
MNLASTIVLTLLFVLFPALVIWLGSRVKLIEKLGIVIVCYLCGMLLGNSGLLPESFHGVQTTLQDISVCLALPFVLFSLDFKKWIKTARSAIVSMLFSIVSLAVVVLLLHLAFCGIDPNTAQYAGLSMGVYTGGTPNIASIKTAIGVDEETFILFTTYDAVLGMAYILFVTSIAQKFFQKVFGLKPYSAELKKEISVTRDDYDYSYDGIFEPAVFKKLCLAFLLSAAILGVSYIAGLQVPGYETAVTILCITTISILCSFIAPVRNIKKTTPAGMYIIYVFCFTVATMADFSKLLHINWVIMLFILLAMFGTMTLHAVLCRIAGIDSDTMIITSVSAICSPPFVPVAADALKNRAVMVSGLATGIIGYAIGNYLGILVYTLFSSFPF